MLLNRIRDNNLTDLYQEYKDFKKFYKVDNLKKKKSDSQIVKLNIPKKINLKRKQILIEKKILK